MEDEFRKMAVKCSKNTTILLLIVFALLSNSNVVQGWRRLSKEEDLELDNQLHLINKPAIKSLQTEYGDIVDCIDIYKQLAFDHPLLKNHALQMKPKTIPKGLKDEGLRTNVFLSYVANISCPPGSVPIRRSTKEDLRMDKYQKSARRNYLTNKSWRLASPGHFPSKNFATMVYRGTIYGAKAAINIWKPTVSTNQYSRASMQIGNNKEVISTGWEVRKWNYSRLYISWSGHGVVGSECINVACPGFVQVSHKIALGTYLQPSTYNGHQYEIKLNMYQDRATGNWWFVFRNDYIGYWPQELFTSLAQGATGVSWGGHVSGLRGELSPAMGSGEFLEEGYSKSAFVKGVKVLTGKKYEYEDPDQNYIYVNVDKPYCYNASHKIHKDPQWGHHLYFGGPGKCSFD